MEGNNFLLFGFGVVVLSLAVNTVVMLVLRLRNSNRRTLKNVKDSIKAYRDEVAASSNRIREESLQAEARVRAVCEEGDGMVSRVTDALETIAVHQQDLEGLLNLCTSYHNSLERLRVATEHAEARIGVVQEETRKNEAVSEFVSRAESDFNRLAQQLQTAKAEYVKLVTSTEASLRANAESQKAENEEMLGNFQTEFEGFRTAFSTFVTNQRTDFSTFSAMELEKAQEAAASMEDRRVEVTSQAEGMQDLASKAEGKLEGLLSQLRTSVDELSGQAERVKQSFHASIEEEKLALGESFKELEKGREDAVQLMQEKISSLLEGFDSEAQSRRDSFAASSQELALSVSETVESAKNSLNEALDEFSAAFGERKEGFSGEIEEIVTKANESLNASAEEMKVLCEKHREDVEASMRGNEDRAREIHDSLSARFREEERQTKQLLQDARQEAETIDRDVMKTSLEAVEAVVKAREDLGEALDAFSSTASGIIAKSFDDMGIGVDRRWKKIADTVNEFVSTLNSVVSDTRETITQLSEGESERIHEAVERLSGLDRKIESANEQLRDIAGTVTKTREELFNAQQDKSRIESELEERMQDLKELQAAITAAKEKRVSAEASLVRLKAEAGKIRKLVDRDAGESPKAGLYEDMIEEFPDELLTGQVEEVDLSDD